MTLAVTAQRFAGLLLGWLSACHRDRRDRQLLAALDRRMLRDLGLERGAVESESTQGFWR